MSANDKATARPWERTNEKPYTVERDSYCYRVNGPQEFSFTHHGVEPFSHIRALEQAAELNRGFNAGLCEGLIRNSHASMTSQNAALIERVKVLEGALAEMLQVHNGMRDRLRYQQDYVEASREVTLKLKLEGFLTRARAALLPPQGGKSADKGKDGTR